MKKKKNKKVVWEGEQVSTNSLVVVVVITNDTSRWQAISEKISKKLLPALNITLEQRLVRTENNTIEAVIFNIVHITENDGPQNGMPHAARHSAPRVVCFFGCMRRSIKPRNRITHQQQ